VVDVECVVEVVDFAGADVAAAVVPGGAEPRGVGAWVCLGRGGEYVEAGLGLVGRTDATETPGGAPLPKAHPSTVPGGGT
jgi:hypothetical protein